jgi:periplasmic protein TonB
MAETADMFEQRDDIKVPLGASVALHAMLFGGILLYAAVGGGMHREDWGGGGSGSGAAMSATLVSGLPLPAREAPKENVLANESKGVSQSLPKQVEQVPPEAIAIPDRESKKVKKDTKTATNPKPQPVEQASNVVPFGQGGPVSAPFTTFSAGAATGGLSFGGGGGDFGSRYAWYVDKVRRVVSENWLKYEVDPNVVNSKRVYLTFDIQRNGAPANVQVEQSSGIPSLDISARRALQRIETFGPLPPDYRGDKVSVEFWFDYRR